MMKHFTFSAPGRILSGLLLFLFLSNSLSGQVANYTFSQSNRTYNVITEGTVLGSNLSDELVFNNNVDGATGSVTDIGFPIGFNFTYNGNVYDRFAVATNGYIVLGTGRFTIANVTSGLFGAATVGTFNAIAPMQMDLVGQLGSQIMYVTTGVFPNRILTVQWKGIKRYNIVGATSNLNFQIKLYETSNTISFIYGSNVTNTSWNPLVGLKGATNSDFNSRKTAIPPQSTSWNTTAASTANNENCTLSSAVFPAQGLTFTWSPPVCNTITTFPFTETFESTSTTRPCWTNSFVSRNANWTYNTGAGSGSITSAHGGTHNARFVSQSGNGTPVTKLVSPVLNLTGVVNPVLDFWYGQESWKGDYNELKVYYRSSTSDVWNLIADLDQIKNVWTEVKNISLPNPSATYQLAFEGINYYGHANVLDDIVIKAGPPPIVITPGSTQICTGGSVGLTASSTAVPAYSYTWSPAAGLNTTIGSNVIATPSSTTTYLVTGTNGVSTMTQNIKVIVSPPPTAVTVTEIPVSSGGTYACDLDYVKLSATGGIYTKSVLNENFEGNAIGWTNNSSNSGASNWTFRAYDYEYYDGFDYYYFNSNDSSRYILSNSDQQGGNAVTTLVSPSFSLLNMSNALLTFYSYYKPNTGDSANIDISLDGGANWINNIVTYNSQIGTEEIFDGDIFSVYTDQFFAKVSVNLTPYVGNANVKLRFQYAHSDDYWWAIDNVSVEGSYQEISWSPVAGLFTDSALTIPYLANANVTTVYAAPELSTAYTASASIGTCSKTATTSPILRTKKNFTGADAANPTHWNVPQNWSLNAVPTLDKCVTIPSGKSVVVNIPTAEAKSIRVGQGAKLTILKDQVLTVKETFTNAAAEGDVIIESDGSLRQLNDIITVPNSGSVTARREITVKDNNQYNYLISPLIGSNLKTNIYEHQTTGVLSSSVYTLYHNEANNKFYSSTGAYIQGRSLAVKEPAASIVPAGGKINAHFIGVPMNGPFTYTLANSGTVATGYNLIGNPYPSNIDLDKFYNLKSNKDKISATFYFWDNTVNTETIQWGNEYDGAAYAIFNAVAGGEGTGVVAGSLASNSTAGTKEPTKVVKPGQGFMVRSISPTNKTIDFSNDIRIAELGTVFFGKNGVQYAEDDRFYLKLTTPSGVVTQTATVYFDEGNTGFSQDDSELNGTPSDVIYTFIGERKVLINGRAPFSDSDVIPVGSRHFAPGLYTIEIARKEGVFATGQNIYLKDNQTGTITNLSEGAYTFMTQAGESTGRFEIVYKPGGVLATDAAVKEDVVVYRDGQDFVVRAQRDPITSVKIFDAAGRMVRRVETNSTVERLDFSAIINGTYILKIDQKGKITVKKVIK